MMTIQIAPVRKTLTVKAPVSHAFRVFTSGIDTWWPRTHHTGKTPMTRNVIEGRVGGRCYSEHEDGAQCDWGSVQVWDPPHRFVMAWMLSPAWQFEPDLAKASEVEVRFTQEGDGVTRVELEHRHFERCGEGAETLRTAVDSSGGWTGLLDGFRAKAEAAQ